MLIAAASLALGDILSPPFRAVLVKSLALTIALLVGLWLLVEGLVARYVATPWPWLDALIDITAGIGLVIGLGFLVAPVTALFAGLFLDTVAETVEREHYAHEPIGRPQPFLSSLVASLQILLAVILVNAIALPLVLFAGFGVVIFLLANAYLLGREYFELAALRHHDRTTVRSLSARYASRVFAAGFLIALFLAIPIVNLLGPLFATAFMVHVAKRITALDTSRVVQSDSG